MYAKIRTSLLAAGISSLAVLAVPAHATDGYFLNGVGAKAKGAGGASIADAQDSLGIVANPAAATEIGARLDVGVEIFIPDRGAAISGNGAGLNGKFSGNGANPFVLPEFGYVRPLSDKVALGIAISGNGGMNTVYKHNPFASFGATGAAGVDLKQIFISPTLAVRLAEGQSVGVSPVIMVQGFRAIGIQPFAAASADPAHFTNRGTDWAAGAGVRIGWLGRFGKAFSAGAFYQSKISSGRFDKYAGLFSDKGSFDVPASWGFGVAVRPVDRLTIAADFKRIEYAGVASVGNPLSVLFTGTPFGAKDGPGFGWRNISVYKVGLTYKASERITLRTGYGRSGNPVPSSETLLNILAPGVVRDHYTLGATWTPSSGPEVTGFVMHAPSQTVKGSGSIPAPYGGGEADVRLGETSFGLSFGFRL
ncbi:outer membrane protein transport protein [Novosphingobium sp. KCTC 2891]|uniref:OmpP1/FadL family transporter n=1 Tax=Novosphingobium sp. KCTC 2891 TaxID=2989730 RepID=UPI002223528B|nr:outer membrane protein transport protein [Novosphingobium sp. KCTC 2891]MCW1384072.1 outer membrane protein transport protein [Novosphingobium sp. KCTC 2891]